MSHRLRHVHAVLLLILGLAAAAPAAASAFQIGIADNNPLMYQDPRFQALHIKQTRIGIPWDVVTRRADRTDLARLDQFVAAATAQGIKVTVSFGADSGKAGNTVPTTRAYTKAMRAFLKRYPQVRSFTAWDEPDWPYRPGIAGRPWVPAGYFNTLSVLCHCRVWAGDVFLPAPLLRPWLERYARYLHHRPAGWALHNYTDARTHSSAQLRTLESLTSGPIMLDETGGVLRRGHWPYRNQSANAAARDEAFLISLGRRHHRVAIIDHYQWFGNAAAGWDSGLISPRNAARPAYNVLYSYLFPKRHKASRRKAATRRAATRHAATRHAATRRA